MIHKLARTMITLHHGFLSADPLKRYIARYSLASSIARSLGFQLYNKNMIWQADQEYLEVWQHFEPGQTRIKDRKFILYSIAKSLRTLPGDTAECGAGRGGSSFLICWVNQGKTEHLHHIFDSFEGMSEPEEADVPLDDQAKRWNKRDLAFSLSDVQSRLSCFDFVRYYPGWIPDRFQEVADRQFSLVHVDVNLYQPTYDSIAFFYERMVPGGIILCDDYGSAMCPGATKAFDEFIHDKPEGSVIHLTSGQGFIIRR